MDAIIDFVLHAGRSAATKSKYPAAWYPPFSGRVKHGPSRECGKEAAGAAIPVRRVLPVGCGTDN